MSTTLCISEEAPPIRVYTLAEPDTGEVRYVGKTTDPLWKRLSNHCSVGKNHPNTYVGKWVGSVLARGQRPVISLLEEVPAGGDWEEVERYWIRQLGLMGCRLANSALGGGDNSGWKMRPEGKAKISAFMKQKCADPAERARLASISNGKPPHYKGEANSFARFTEAQVIEMRERRAAGEGPTSIAKTFGTSAGTVQDIVTGKTWVHVGGPIHGPKKMESRKGFKEIFTSSQVDEMVSLAISGCTLEMIAARFETSVEKIRKFLVGRKIL